MVVLTAVYLINGIPSRVLQGLTPFQVLRPDSTMFPLLPHVFGCTCFVQNRSPTRTKLDDKAIHCIFLGYSSLSKGYRWQANGRCIIFLVYVDDIILIGDDATGIAQVKKDLSYVFDVKDLGSLKYFLGIEIARSRQRNSLSQRKYTLDLLQDTGMMDCKPTSTPMDPNLKLIAKTGELLSDPSMYQRSVGQLIYLSNTRSDLTFAISVVSQFKHAPRTAHLDVVYHIL